MNTNRTSSSEETEEDKDRFGWDSRESASPSPKQSGAASHSPSPTRISAKRSLPTRPRPSVGNSASPLHVAAMFASAAKAAVIGTDSRLIRDAEVGRLFMNADEVFKAWEENMRLSEAEGAEAEQGDACKVRKNASVHGRKEAEKTTRWRNAKTLQRTQSSDLFASSSTGSLKLSTGSMPSERLAVVAHQRQLRSASINQHKSSQQSLTGTEPGRRYSDRSGSGEPTEMRKVALENDYRMVRELATGQFSSVHLAEHKQSSQRVSLKMFSRPGTRQVDFEREYQLARFLSAHPSILDTFDGCFETDDESAFFFAQECASEQHSLRDLLTNHPGGINEQATKMIMLKVLAALEFMHSEGLVHRNLRAESVVILDTGKLTRVKLTDFGLTRPADSVVRHQETVSSYHAPELCDKVPNESYAVAKSADIWAWGILMAHCLKGKFPWQKATIMCKSYWEWEQWMKRKMPQLSKYWEPFSEKALKLFKHTLIQKAKERWETRELRKFVEKERMLKIKAVMDDIVYYPVEGSSAAANANSTPPEQKPQPKKSVIGQWINHTLNTMSEISEQVVSARDDD